MKRYRFSHHGDVKLTISSRPIDYPEIDSTQDDGVLNIVYANDPVTGRPRSDLGTYLAEGTNPLVRDYIERELRSDFSQRSNPVPEGITDYDISYLTRDVKETESEYLSRVNSYLLRQKSIYQRVKSAQSAQVNKVQFNEDKGELK